MKNFKIYLQLLLFYLFLSCNNEKKTSLNIHIVNFIKSNKYKTYHEAINIPKFIIDDLVYKNDSNTYFQDLKSTKKIKVNNKNVLTVLPDGKKYLYSVLLSENVCLISYNIRGDIYSTNYVDFYIFKNSKFHKKFKVSGIVNTKESLIKFFETNRDVVFIEDFKY